jgi:hypothetical protein
MLHSKVAQRCSVSALARGIANGWSANSGRAASPRQQARADAASPAASAQRASASAARARPAASSKASASSSSGPQCTT